MKVLLVLILVAGALAWPVPPLNDDTCKFTRKDALKCAHNHGDNNRNQSLTLEEINTALDTLVPWWIRKLPSILTGVDAARVMRDCDYNKDGVLTPRDWEMATETCMPRQQDLCKFKWFCDRN